MKKFYIADLHLYHTDIIRTCNRPFNSIDEMHQEIVLKWNNKVKKNDIVHILGDVGAPTNKVEIKKIAKLLKYLNGKKILVIGNHDREAIKDIDFRRCFLEIKEYHRVYDSGKKVVMFHYPIEDWEGAKKGVYHLHGHIHKEHITERKNRYNVGADILNFEPMTLKEIVELNNEKDLLSLVAT